MKIIKINRNLQRGKPIEQRFWESVDKKTDGECWNWTAGIGSCGYGAFQFGKGQQRAHRYSFMLHGGIFNNGPLVLHSCNNRRCVNPNHLRSGTHKENALDREIFGTVKRGDDHHSRIHPELVLRGEQNGASKLTEKSVLKIRKLLKKGFTLKKIASLFGVTFQAIWCVKMNKVWSHVQ